MGIPDHLTCLLRNLYAGQEATVRAGHGTTEWFQTGKGNSSQLSTNEVQLVKSQIRNLQRGESGAQGTAQTTENHVLRSHSQGRRPDGSCLSS